MFRLIFVFALVAIIAAVFLWAGQFPWRVVLETDQGVDYEISIGVAIILIAMLGLVFGVIWLFVHGVWKLPSRVRNVRQRNRNRRATDALAKGLLAIEVGDIKTANKMAYRAAKDAEDERLSLLLEARSAEESNDWPRAERAYDALLKQPESEEAALKGLTYTALKRGDSIGAKKRAHEALELRALSSDWPFTALFDLHIINRDWSGALDSLLMGERKGIITGDVLRRRRAVLKAALAMQKVDLDPAGAEKLFHEAIKSAPSLTPAVLLHAMSLASQQKERQAISGLEAGWKAEPHAGIPVVLRQIAGSDSRDALTRMAQQAANHREGKILKAEIEIAADNWDGAETALKPLLEPVLTTRICALMETVKVGQGDPAGATQWARRIATAEPEADGSLWRGIRYSEEDWADLVYAFGDTGQVPIPKSATRPQAIKADAAPAPLPLAESTLPPSTDDGIPPAPDYVKPR